MVGLDFLYRFVSPENYTNARKNTKLGIIPKKQLPHWAERGKNEGFRTVYRIYVHYKNPSGNSYNDWCTHIERLKEIAKNKNLSLEYNEHYTTFLNRFERDVATIFYRNFYSNEPHEIYMRNTRQAQDVINECMQDFKKYKI